MKGTGAGEAAKQWTRWDLLWVRKKKVGRKEEKKAIWVMKTHLLPANRMTLTVIAWNYKFVYGLTRLPRPSRCSPRAHSSIILLSRSKEPHWSSPRSKPRLGFLLWSRHKWCQHQSRSSYLITAKKMCWRQRSECELAWEWASEGKWKTFRPKYGK